LNLSEKSIHKAKKEKRNLVPQAKKRNQLCLPS
jgi:hypothetical protein